VGDGVSCASKTRPSAHLRRINPATMNDAETIVPGSRTTTNAVPVLRSTPFVVHVRGVLRGAFVSHNSARTFAHTKPPAMGGRRIAPGSAR
jgi:hypothetical protein